MGTGFYGPTAVNALCYAIEECLEEWGDDPAYGKAAQKLREVQRELEALTQAPGMRHAARLEAPNHSGQEPGEYHGDY